MENQTDTTGLRLSTGIPVSSPPRPKECDPNGHTMLLAIESFGVIQGAYMVNEEQYYQHCQRYDSFDDEPVEGWTREEEINNNLEWEMEEVYPESHELAEFGSTVTHWMLIVDPPTEG